MQSEKEGDDRLCTSNVAPVAGLFQNKEMGKNRDLTKPRRRRQRERLKHNRFCEQNKNSAYASRLLVQLLHNCDVK